MKFWLYSAIICGMAGCGALGYWGGERYFASLPADDGLNESFALEGGVIPHIGASLPLMQSEKPKPLSAIEDASALSLPPPSALAPPPAIPGLAPPGDRRSPQFSYALPNTQETTLLTKIFPNNGLNLFPSNPDNGGAMGLLKGAPVYVRIFKKEAQLELWLKRNGRYALFRTFPICKLSGHLGPKEKYADYQSPEGFYSVSAKQLNPHSNYHRAFDIGYPNAYDRQFGRTGNLIMVHGDCRSVGCFAMTNKGVEEIYGYVEAALKNGQHDVQVHIFPFRMTDQAIKRESAAGPSIVAALTETPAPPRDWSNFWRNLKEGYDLFEKTGEPPTAYACNQRYAFSAAGPACRKIAGW